MSVNIVVEWNAKPGMIDELIAKVRAVIDGTLAFEGCEEVRILQDQEDPNTLLMVEKWASRGRYVAYQEWRKSEGTGGSIREMLVTPPVFKTFDDVAL